MRIGGKGILVLCVVVCLVVGCDGPPPPVLERASLVGHAAEIVALAYTPDGKTLVTRGPDAIKVWDAGTLQEQGSLPSDRTDFGALAISPDGRTLAATLADRGIVTWNLRDRSEQRVYRLNPASPADSGGPEAFGWGLAYAPNGATLAGPSEDRGAAASIQLWNLATHAPTGLGPPQSPATHLAFTPDGRALITKGMEGRIHVWDVATGTERTSIDAETSYLAAISISPDGRTVASSGADRYLRIWRVDTGKEVAKLKAHLKAILGIALHPDGRHAVTGDSAGTIFLWNLPAKRVIAQFKGHQGKVWALAFRPDGKELASAGEDRRIRLWDAAQAIATYGP